MSRSPDEIFNDALELPPDQRPGFLARACSGDDALRSEIQELLRIAERDTGDETDEVVPDHVGRYRILGELGRGGMGIVYRALDPDLNRAVALKLLPTDRAPHDRAYARFEREARILAGFTDPRIATIHSIEESDGVRFVTMELVEGETLEALIARGPLSPEHAARITRQIAAALVTAHAAGVVHRDIKPGNVIVRTDGLVKVLDFGIARVVHGAGNEGAEPSGRTAAVSGLQGTPAYISPEVIAGAEASPRSDLWATGCLLSECLTGRCLFPSSFAGLDDPRPLPELPRSVPRALRNLVRDCLQHDPERRIRSAEEVRARLESFLGRRTRTAVQAAVALTAVVAVGVGIARFLDPAPALKTIEIFQDRHVRGLDERDNVLWQRDLGDRIVRNYAVYGYKEAPHPILEVDGSLCAFVGTYGDAGVPATLFALRGSTGETIWQRAVSWRPPLSARGPLNCRWMFELEGADPAPGLVLGLRDGMWYSMAIRTTRADGTEIGTYYHPGDLFLDSQILMEDGRRALLLFGGNSSARFRRDVVPFETRQHPAVIALVVPGEGDSQAFPYSEDLPEVRDWPGIPRAREEAYLIIPPIHAAAAARIRNVVVTGAGESAVRFLAKLDDGRTFSLDRLLVPLSCFVGIDTPAESLHATAGALPELTLLRNGEIARMSVPTER